MKGIGTDIISIDRIRKIKNRDAFARKILSEQERTIYEAFAHEQRRVEYLAGRFAVKEALYKAAPAFCQGKSYQDFSILNDEIGKPYLLAPNMGKIHLSLSHCRDYAVAFVVVE